MRIVSLVKSKTEPFYDFEKKMFSNDRFNCRLSPVGVYGFRSWTGKRLHDFSSKERLEISGFTRSSRFRLQKRIRESEARIRTFARLSYPREYPIDGRTCKRHWDSLSKRLFRLLDVKKNQDGKYYAKDGRLFSAVWFFEFQDRGAPHFHFLCTHFIDKQWLADSWYNIVRSNDENHRNYGTRIEQFKGNRQDIARYAGKYASKSEQKQVPEGFLKVGRFWGIIGNRTMAAVTVNLDAWDEESMSKGLEILVKFDQKTLNRSTYHEIKNEDGDTIGHWFYIVDSAMQERVVDLIVKVLADAKENVLQAK